MSVHQLNVGTAGNLLGEGVLTWNAFERRSDRYGSVYLIPDSHNSLTAGPSVSLVDDRALRPFIGRAGELIAVVMAIRQSTHIGDMFRGVSPRTPEVGQIIVLGKGMLFSEPAPDSGVTVGLRPANGRDSDWLNIRSLYDVHEQTVRLFFHPDE